MPLSISLYKSDMNLYFHPVLCMGNYPWRFYDVVLPFVLKLSYVGIIECSLVPACIFQDFIHKSMVMLSMAIVSFQIFEPVTS